jgi:transcriptional regulator with XRE-family HTH domain
MPSKGATASATVVPMLVVSVGHVIGRNARNLRLDAGITLDAVAQASRRYGLNWTTGRVIEIEKGKYTPTLSTLFTLTHILGALSGRPLTVRALLGGGDDIAVTDTVTLSAAAVGSYFEGEPVVFPEPPVDDDAPPHLVARTNLTDRWAAKALDIDIPTLTGLSLALWNGTFSEERDRRAGPGATKQRKGQFTRELIREITRYRSSQS